MPSKNGVSLANRRLVQTGFCATSFSSSSFANQNLTVAASENISCDPFKNDQILNLQIGRSRTASGSGSTRRESFGAAITDLIQGVYDIKKDLKLRGTSFESGEEENDDPEERIY